MLNLAIYHTYNFAFVWAQGMRNTPTRMWAILMETIMFNIMVANTALPMGHTPDGHCRVYHTNSLPCSHVSKLIRRSVTRRYNLQICCSNSASDVGRPVTYQSTALWWVNIVTATTGHDNCKAISISPSPANEFWFVVARANFKPCHGSSSQEQVPFQPLCIYRQVCLTH